MMTMTFTTCMSTGTNRNENSKTIIHGSQSPYSIDVFTQYGFIILRQISQSNRPIPRGAPPLIRLSPVVQLSDYKHVEDPKPPCPSPHLTSPDRSLQSTPYSIPVSQGNDLDKALFFTTPPSPPAALLYRPQASTLGRPVTPLNRGREKSGFSRVLCTGRVFPYCTDGVGDACWRIWSARRVGCAAARVSDCSAVPIMPGPRGWVRKGRAEVLCV